MYPKPTYVYHITHLDNLSSLINKGGLLACSQINRENISYLNIAYQSIQDRRATTMVPIHPKGNLHDYVPFYFAPRSPMLYTINQGNVSNCREGQKNIIHLVSSVQTIKEAGLQFVFTDGHAIMFYTDFYNDENDLSNIDWGIMKEKYWNDTKEDGDRKRRRQSEFLVHNFLDLSLITGIGVINDRVADRTKKLFEGSPYKIPIRVIPEWYY